MTINYWCNVARSIVIWFKLVTFKNKSSLLDVIKIVTSILLQMCLHHANKKTYQSKTRLFWGLLGTILQQQGQPRQAEAGRGMQDR